jgi:hypothetical protein
MVMENDQPAEAASPTTMQQVASEAPPETSSCEDDQDCEDVQFCDRGFECRVPVSGGKLGNDCDESIDYDLRYDPCGSYYLCIQGFCRSCVADEECGAGRVCYKTGTEAGNMCGG